jgi:hypothetical protein
MKSIHVYSLEIGLEGLNSSLFPEWGFFSTTLACEAWHFCKPQISVTHLITWVNNQHFTLCCVAKCDVGWVRYMNCISVYDIFNAQWLYQNITLSKAREHLYFI